MKSTILILFLALASIARSQAGAGAPGIVSPEVHADRTVTFRISAPNATNVTITCDWLDGAKPLTKADDGIWSVTLGPLPPSSYIYSFNVDGVPTVDPVNPRIKLRARGSASFVVVPSETPGVQEVRDVPHGTVQVVWQKSTVLGGETRRFLVYTPPGYAQNTYHRYPLLLLLHGSNDTSDGWTSVGNVNFIADNLIAEKKMVPMVVVIPNFYPVSSTNSGPRGGGGRGGDGGAANSKFYKYLLDEVIPAVESKYRIAAGRKNHAVAGFSMGANQSLDLFFNHFDLFSSVGALCPSKYEPIENSSSALFADAKNLNAKTGVIWVGCGRQDPDHFGGSQRVADVLAAHQINHIWHPTEGVHNYKIWRDYLVEFLPLLFKPSPAAARPAVR
jgi:enterochelin esterase family protein